MASVVLFLLSSVAKANQHAFKIIRSFLCETAYTEQTLEQACSAYTEQTLEKACVYGDTNIVRLSLKNNADVNVMDKCGVSVGQCRMALYIYMVHICVIVQQKSNYIDVTSGTGVNPSVTKPLPNFYWIVQQM